jgi:hypothetical protein
LRPQTLNGWNYGYNNPINFTDPSGKDVYWPTGELQIIAELKEDILASAKRHNTPRTNMDDASFAALMTAILHWEGKLPGNAKPQFEQFKDFVGDLGATLINYDASTGIANVRPSVAKEILQGYVPGVEETFCYEISGGLNYEQAVEVAALRSLRSDTGNQHYPVERVLFFELQNRKKSIEYLAANTQRGADRISSLGFKASVFNLASWANAGVQTPSEFLEPGIGPKGQSYGNTMLNTMPEAFEVLFGPGFVGRYLAYNAYEVQFIDVWLREPNGCTRSKGVC